MEEEWQAGGAEPREGRLSFPKAKQSEEMRMRCGGRRRRAGQGRDVSMGSPLTGRGPSIPPSLPFPSLSFLPCACGEAAGPAMRGVAPGYLIDFFLHNIRKLGTTIFSKIC